MYENYIKYKESEHLRSVIIEDKNKLFIDISNIENSWTGRRDTKIANNFILEASILLINSIKLFESGYFDAAYYSLRQALELSTTMIYLSDIPEELRKEKIASWINTEDFPMQGQMLAYLKDNGNIFADMRLKLSSLFEEIKMFNKTLNKYVHKQGLRFFYISRNSNTNQNDPILFTNQFVEHLKKTISYVSIMRLAIDPFPIILLDEEMYHRSFEPITESYSYDFVNEYIEKETLEKYKQTEVYKNLYDYLMTFGKRSECTTDIIKYQYVDISQLEVILEERSLLSDIDNLSIDIYRINNKISKIYYYNGLLMYSSNRHTNKKNYDFSSSIFKSVKNDDKYNYSYQGDFLSAFNFNNEVVYVQHFDKLSQKEIMTLNKLDNNYQNI